MPILRLHERLARSRANGPGCRAAIWVQGCNLACPGCFNPSSWDREGGSAIDVTDLATWIEGLREIRGITISGGEPMLQARALLKFLSLIDKALDVVLFSGMTLHEVKQNSLRRRLLLASDAALLGRYDRQLAHPFESKRLVLVTDRINADDLSFAVHGEVAIDSRGLRGVVTGLARTS